MDINQQNRLFEVISGSEGLIIRLTQPHLPHEVDAEILKHHIFKLLESNAQSTVVIVDFANVRFFSSAFVGTLLMVRERVRTAGGRLVVCGMSVPIREVMGVMQLNQLFDAYESVEAFETARNATV